MTNLTTLFKDPPPAFAFELSEDGIAYAQRGAAEQHSFKRFDVPVLKVSPVHDNVQNADALKATIDTIVPQDGKKRRAALILPDYCGRVAVLDFNSFPAAPEEQLALVRFRMKKSVPFDVDTAVVAYYPQPRVGKGNIDVVVAVMAREIVTRYEAPFRAAALQPGDVTTSSLAMLNSVQPDGLTMVAKLCGRTLSAMVLDGSTLKLFRCVEMEDTSRTEIEAVLHPTFVYIEDELHRTLGRLLLCGFGSDGPALAQEWQSQWNAKVELLRSRFGAPAQTDAGLLGYLEAQ
jgi:type IV pilus assembly protein PilM